MSEVRIDIVEDGPYAVSGSPELRDPAGNAVAGQGEPIYLCRCGGSTTKPFCDGTHSKIGFQGAIAAVESEG